MIELSIVIDIGKHDFGAARADKCVGIWIGFVAIYIYFGHFVSDMAKIKVERDELLKIGEILDKETVAALKERLSVK